MEAGTLQKSQFLNFYISSSLKHISTKRHIFVIFCASNLFVDSFCSLRLTFSEFFKSNVVLEKGYWKFRVCCEQKGGGRKTEKFLVSIFLMIKDILGLMLRGNVSRNKLLMLSKTF